MKNLRLDIECLKFEKLCEETQLQRVLKDQKRTDSEKKDTQALDKSADCFHESDFFMSSFIVRTGLKRIGLNVAREVSLW